MYHATINGQRKIDIEFDNGGMNGTLDGKPFSADVANIANNKAHWLFNDRSYNVEVVQVNTDSKEVTVKVNGRTYAIQVKDRYDDLLKSLGMESTGKAKLSNLKAPMPGLVLDILVTEGQSVEKDTPLLILEAMKMENVIKSPSNGVVKKVTAIKGNAVEKNNVLIEFV